MTIISTSFDLNVKVFLVIKQSLLQLFIFKLYFWIEGQKHYNRNMQKHKLGDGVFCALLPPAWRLAFVSWAAFGQCLPLFQLKHIEYESIQWHPLNKTQHQYKSANTFTVQVKMVMMT